MSHCRTTLVNGTIGETLREYFVVGPEPIVAQDLADAIRANDPQAKVSLFQSPPEVIEILPRLQPKAIVVHREPGGFLDTALGRALVAAEVPYGFLCTACDEAGGAAILQSPFTEATVRVLLDELAARPRSEA